jgi:hypothetical protein
MIWKELERPEAGTGEISGAEEMLPVASFQMLVASGMDREGNVNMSPECPPW